MLKSLKSRIALGSLLVLALALSASGLVLYYCLVDELSSKLRDSARMLAQGAAAQAHVEHDFLEIYHNRVDQYVESGPGLFLQILNKRGIIIYGVDHELPGIDYLPANEESETWREFNYESVPALALKYTFVATHEYGYETDSAAPYYATVIVAVDRTPMLSSLERFRKIIITMVIAGSLIGAALLTLLARVTTKPLSDLAREIDGIDHQSLRPVSEIRNLPSECISIYEELNLLIGRLDEAFRREREFTANISHELRTPLTGLRSTLEVSSKRDQTPEEFQDSQATCLKIVLEIQQLVEQLLQIQRMDSGNYQPNKEAIQLTDCVQAAWDRFAERAESRDLQLDLIFQDSVMLMVPLDLLMVIMNNLIENAVEYAKSGGRLAIALTRNHTHWELSIANSQEGLTNENLDRMFDPFWRHDDSRSATGAHAGLGLSIVRSMVKLCDLKLEARLDSDMLVMTLSGDIQAEFGQQAVVPPDECQRSYN